MSDFDRPKAPVYLNLLVPLDQDGVRKYVKLPVGVPIDPSLESYSDKVRSGVDDNQKLILQMLVDTLKQSGSDKCSFALEFDCTLQKTGVKETLAPNEGLGIVFSKKPTAV